MSVVPSMSAAIPAPEPGPLTAIFTCELAFMKSSAHTELNGVTVFEPIILKEPERTDVVGLGVDVLLQPARIRAISIIAAKGMNHFGVDRCKLFFLLYI